jgi:hypothetical protein
MGLRRDRQIFRDLVPEGVGVRNRSRRVTDWREETYRQIFEETCKSLEAGLRDNHLTRAELERLLEAMYVDEGNDWLGRGALQEVTQSATIAAHEHVLAELPEEQP